MWAKSKRSIRTYQASGYIQGNLGITRHIHVDTNVIVTAAPSSSLPAQQVRWQRYVCFQLKG
jgi:hypothetical protein